MNIELKWYFNSDLYAVALKYGSYNLISKHGLGYNTWFSIIYKVYLRG